MNTKTYQNIINGLETSSEGELFEKYNPALKSELLGRFHDSTPSDLSLAVESAKRAFEHWSRVSAVKRGEILYKAAQITIEEKVKLANILSLETGKNKDEAEGEIQEVVDTYLFFAGEGRRLYGMTGQSELQNKSIITIRQPIGVCGFITAWNFPAAVPSWKIAPSLIAGNTFILKPSTLAPLSAYYLIQNLYKAGLPTGCANLLFGDGTLGQLMAEHEEIKIISLTGSTEVGSKVNEICGKQLKKCALELGGKNAIIGLKDANIDLLLEGVLWGAFGTAGQRCTSTSRLILQKCDWTNDFLEKLKNQAQILNINPIISDSQLNNIHGFVQRALKAGGNLLCGGKILDEKGYFYAPTIITNIKPKDELAQKEVFGPVLAVIEVNNFEEALQVANDSIYGLSLSIYTNNINYAMKASQELQAGLVYINAPTIGAECGGASAFGGWKKTGNGTREGGITALDTYTQYKTIYLDYSDKLQKAQYIEVPE